MSTLSWRRLPQDEPDCISKQSLRRWPFIYQSQLLSRFPWGISISIGATSLFWIIIAFGFSNLLSVPGAVDESIVLHCGNSTAQARELDCVYDILLIHWIPQSCVDTEALNKYKAYGSWQAYGDDQGLEPLLNIETMSERQIYWTSLKDHARHCAIMWQKQFRGFLNGRMDSLSLSYSHTEHCSKTLMYTSELDSEALDKTFTSVNVGFAKCTIGKRYR